MNVKIEVIPHDQQRYPTVGDWYYEPNGDLVIRVSKLSDQRREMLIAVHELVEVLMCQKNSVTQEQVDKFDIEFEKSRAGESLPSGTAKFVTGMAAEVDEPGDHPSAPYRTEHCFATGVERLLAASLDVCWADYEKELEALP